MLQGAKRTLAAGMVDFVFISTHGKQVHHECLELVKSYRFRVLAEHSKAESFSVDGLIVACSMRINLPEISLSKRKRPITRRVGSYLIYPYKRTRKYLRQKKAAQKGSAGQESGRRAK
jgi:hypothetical protein